MSTLRAAALAAVLALAALPAAAQAGQIEYTSTNVLGHTAAAGEANDLTMTRVTDRIVHEEHGGVTISAASASEVADCDGEGTGRVACKIDHTPVFVAGAVLGDQDDRGVAGPLGGIDTSLDGDAGADELDASGATASATLNGDAGNDRLLARARRQQHRRRPRR